MHCWEGFTWYLLGSCWKVQRFWTSEWIFCKAFPEHSVDDNKISIAVELFPWNKCLHTSAINCKDAEQTWIKDVANRTAGRQRGLAHPSDCHGLLWWPHTSQGCISPWVPWCWPLPWARVSALPWPNPVPREVSVPRAGAVPSCSLLDRVGLTSSCPPGEAPSPEHPDTRQSFFPILLPCCRISTLDAITSTDWPNLFLENGIKQAPQASIGKGRFQMQCERNISFWNAALFW